MLPWTLFFLANFLWESSHSLKLTEFYVPRSPRGTTDEVHMNCKYDLEGEVLYDVKWYKDDMQFFRCMANGSVHDYQLEGVKLRSSSYAAIGSCPITLIGLTSRSGGTYKCEVTLDDPAFRMVSGVKVFKVVQSSRRTQEFNDVSSERIRSSPIKNQTNVPLLSSGGDRRLQPIITVYVVVFIVLLFCRL
ncbi:uncharacterized protein [Euwallacea fornicatus]|uniref:uncharacterized protein n=1 Tax=Euwallacea fornicatus TaxID=995702 RepID=UPI00338FE5BC